MTNGLTLMATTTDCEVCSTPRLISVDDDVTTAPLEGMASDDGAPAAAGVAIPDAS